MPVFEVEITDIYGNVLATPTQFSGLSATLPIAEARTGKVTLSNYDPATAWLVWTNGGGHKIAALSRMVRLKYRGYTLIWGFVHSPKWSTDRAQVEINIVDPTIKLKHRQLNLSDDITSPENSDEVIQNPSDWRTVRDIVEAAYNTKSQADANVPDIGIEVTNIDALNATDAFWVEIQRGSNNWDKILEVSKGPYGPEFDVVPHSPDPSEIPFDATPVTVTVVGPYTFPNSPRGTGQTPATIPIDPGGLALAASGTLRAGIIDGTGIHRRYTLTYTGRTDTSITGVTGYPAQGQFLDADPITTFGGAKPYHYADLLCYDQIGINRTGMDLSPDPDNPGEFLDPVIPGTGELHLLYDDQNLLGMNLKSFNWEPDGENCRNQMVSLVSSGDPSKRGIRKIARNINSWLEIGVYSGWDSISGANIKDISADNLEGHAKNEVERYGRPPSFFKVELKTEPADGTPEAGTFGHQPQWIRDFYMGDRITARGRQGYMDSGDIVARIMQVTISQLDADNNVKVELDCVPHMTDVSEISVA